MASVSVATLRLPVTVTCAHGTGAWLLVTVPETRRQLRHKLRTRLTWAGFGSPLPGVWVSPHPAREAEAKQVTEQLGLAAETFSFTGPFAGIGAQRSLVEQAWHLDDLAPRYQAFLARFEDLRPEPGDGTLLAQIRLVDEWRRFPLADPGLPRELLPPDWIGARAAAVFGGLHRAWEAPARARLPGGPGPAHWEMVTSPDWSVAEITCGDVGLCGTPIEVWPDEVFALTR